jgi:MEMO1 family protein
MKSARIALLMVILCLICNAMAGSGAKSQSDVRLPVVAGQFYSSDPAKLALGIREFLKDSVKVSIEKPVAILVPHAGYFYAGQIYADAYRQVMGADYDDVVILGTNHTDPKLSGISVYERGVFRTPLGDVPINETLTSALLAEDKDCTSNRQAQVQEHSVEVQLPFIQILFPEAKIVPLVVGSSDARISIRFGQALAKVLKGRRALIVISSDLSHYPNYEDAIKSDRLILQSAVALDPNEFMEKAKYVLASGIPELTTCACGEAPIMAGLAAAKALGATKGIIMSYANSGDIAIDDRSRVVGYGAVALASGPGPGDAQAFELRRPSSGADPLGKAEKRTLLSLARETIVRFLTTETVPLVRGGPARLQVPQGAFVTLKKQGELRGCIGNLTPEAEVGKTVSAMARQAAFFDPRFSPVTLKEISDIEIEISVLTPMKPVSSSEQIRIGTDGVVLAKAGKSAVFLPQVATEQHWDRVELLNNLARKAGLPEDAWKSGARLLVFQADVFSEADFK